MLTPSSSVQVALRRPSLFLLSFKDRMPYSGTHSKILSVSPRQKTGLIKSCAISMTAGQSDGPMRLNLEHTMGEMSKVWESFPEPIKTFPWARALENFRQLILGLVCAVTKYLCIPFLAVSSLSEMSYAAHERKLALIPIPLFAGMGVAGLLKETALELYPHLKEGAFPWHLVAMAFIFALLKLPGPYYPYWGRLLIPHFANGGLVRTLWFAFRWLRKSSQGASEAAPLPSSIDDQQFVRKL